ncbi:glutamate receptor 2.7-like [Salvia splendens]|uniref:glutamate receptor 2.7-like n=1 Tax=Salvia splendens TaxID=180675 RepID=UPI001C26292B|nr:glutamate receptor 2.7-like [Salvia splendens]
MINKCLYMFFASTLFTYALPMQISKCSLHLLMIMIIFVDQSDGYNAIAAKADVGFILDLNQTVGKIIKTCISMAIDDFYSEQSFNTMIVPHFRDSSNGSVAAASAAIDLLKNTQVMAIFGPQRSIQADFVIDIGDQVRVPIISQATSPLLSPTESQHFVRASWCSSSQAKAIAAIVKNFGWREVVFVYEDTNYGSGLMPFLSEGLMQINALVSYQSIVSPSAGDDQILLELFKLKTMQTRVFVVHMLPHLATHFFKMVKEAGMMREGYAWIIADVLTSLLDSVSSETIEAMQGVLGVKAYVPRSKEVRRFSKRWRKRFDRENPEMKRTELNVVGLWAYDTVTALAEAVERVGVASPRFKKPVESWNLTDLEAIGTSNSDPSFIHLIRNSKFKGLSGNFNISNGQLQPSAFEIVSVYGRGECTVGFWSERNGISKELRWDDEVQERGNLGGILWPGTTSIVPKGWEIPTSGKKLRVGVPVKKGFTEFIKVEKNQESKAVKATGFCIDVFEEVMKSMPYAVQFEYIPFETIDGKSGGNYNDLVYQIFTEEYDAVVGDVTIVANRSSFVDFTFPYTESGVAIVVPIKDQERKKNAWIFMKPLTTSLWLTIGAFFVFTGFAVWVLEHRVNKHFQGQLMQQVGMIFWFSFSTLVFAHRERVKSNLTRFVLIVWVFVVLVLTSSYTANLTSMLTLQQLQPKVNEVDDLVKNGEFVGYQEGSFVSGFLMDSMNFDSSKFRIYSSLEEYDDALSRGSRDGGVGAIVDELPYIRLFLSKYCHKYTMIGPTYRTSGFGFAFPKGSPLLPDVSRQILKLKEDDKMLVITRKWLGDEEGCSSPGGAVIASESLTLDSFRGLFLIAGLSSSSALVVYLCVFMYDNRCILTSTCSFKKKICDLARVFCKEKGRDLLSTAADGRGRGERGVAQSQEGMFSQDDGFSTTEPATPIHDNHIQAS